MKLLTSDSWCIRSESDKRWDCDGEGEVGGFIMPPAVREKIDELTQTLGEPPDDLTYNYMKD